QLYVNGEFVGGCDILWEAQAQGDFGFLLLIGVLAPILALAIAGGAGMAVFRGVSGGVTRIISVGATTLPIPR
ncbi:MAG: hypothetical protein AAFO06_20740, partial [Cyanobacteria bacterium J06597_16]